MVTKKRNPQDNTKVAQGKRDRGQDDRVKDLERRVKALEDVVNEFCGTALGGWKKEVERRLYNLEPVGVEASYKDDL